MISLLLILSSLPLHARQLPLEKLKLPPHFKIEVLADVPNAREMAVAPSGTIFVGSLEGKVYAVTRKKLKTEQVLVLKSGVEMPAGVAFNDGDLYYSAVSKIYRLRKIESSLTHPREPELVSDQFPSEAHHGWKYIAFGPDQKLYVPIGAPCNICDKGPKYANIMRMNKDGSGLELFAEGIRNSVGFDWDPRTHELWFTDNGRDLLGDDAPPDELNHAPKKGMHFGYPYCHAGTIPDPDFGKGKSCADYSGPAQSLGPHVAALGMTFYTGKMFPKEYLGGIFIAEHGSWNRSHKVGYRVTFVRLLNGKSVSYKPFVDGWLESESSFGRPTDVKVDLDGALLIADDSAGKIYRVTYDRLNSATDSGARK